MTGMVEIIPASTTRAQSPDGLGAMPVEVVEVEHRRNRRQDAEQGEGEAVVHGAEPNRGKGGRDG